MIKDLMTLIIRGVFRTCSQTSKTEFSTIFAKNSILCLTCSTVAYEYKPDNQVITILLTSKIKKTKTNEVYVNFFVTKV